MGQIISNKPTGGVFRSNKPLGGVFQSNKPTSGLVDQTEGFVYLENKIMLKGQSMGLLLALTYPVQFNFVGERT